MKLLVVSHALRNAWRPRFFQVAPVDAPEKSMRFNLLCTIRPKPIPKVNVEQLGYEVLRLRGNHPFFVAHLRPLETMIGNIINNLLNSFAAKGSSADEQLVCNNSQTPPIYGKIFD